ncbi:MAG TPA: hypothetical protein VFY15_01240 [Acidimicrobiia bacterium]|nr:hypothetical protein [Acidimicrobiia bacterium]
MWATTSTVKAFHEMRHGTRISRRQRNLIKQRERIPVALGRTVVAR